MKKTNLVALTVVFALILNLMMPFMRVIAASSYTITFEVEGTHTLQEDNGHLKIDGQYVDLKDGSNNTIGEVNVSGTTATINVSDGSAGKLNYNSANLFTLYDTNGHVPYNMETELSSNTVFRVEDYSNGNNNNNNNNNPTQTGAFGVRYLRDAGDVWYKFGNEAETKITTDVKGIAITTGKMTIRVEDRTIGAAMLFINGAQQNIDKDVFKTGYTFDVINTDRVDFEIEYISNGGNNQNPNPDPNNNANISVTAGNGTYGKNNTPYDAGTEENFIDVRVSSVQDTTVTFTFETLWIGRFYEDIVINGTPYNVSNYIDFDDRTQWLQANHGTQMVSFDIPNVAKAANDTYNVVVKHGENTGKKYLATFLWTADPAQASGHDYIGNSKLEFVKAVYKVGETTYTVTEEDLEGKLILEGNHKVANSADGFLNYGVTADVNYDDGSLTLPGGAEVTMRVVPEYGYQVTSVNGGNNFKTTESGISEFTVTVEEGTAGYFQATVEKVENTVTPTSEKVKAGNIALGDTAATDIKNGTVRLSVEDVELTSDKITNFEEKASEAGDYKITNYLDINLDKVLYRGTADSVWSEQIHHLTDKALITLQLEEGVDASNIVIVHNIDNGDKFEIIKIESYDPETNTISFYTDSFSNYAIATKTEETKTTDTTSNPKTGDNIIMIISIFAIATVGVFATIKINKNRRIRKH